MNNFTELLGRAKALLPNRSRKTETSREMDYGEIKALETVMDIFKVLRSVNNVQSAARIVQDIKIRKDDVYR